MEKVEILMNNSNKDFTLSYQKNSSNKTPIKEKNHYEDIFKEKSAEKSEFSNLAADLQQYSTISEDEMHVNNILKNLKLRLKDIEEGLFEKENEKNSIIEDIGILTQRLKSLGKSINKKKMCYENYEKTLNDAESAYSKITESTKTLLSVVKKECVNLNKITSR